MTMAILAGKVCVVTGAAGGIGAETVKALCEAGGKVVASDIKQDGLDKVVARLKAEGHEVAGRVTDVGSEDSIRDLVAFTLDTFGRLDVVDNNAGSTSTAMVDKDVVSMTVELWDQVAAVNARGPMLLCKHAIPHMVAQGGGSIINISSGQSLCGDLRNVAYAASKAALNAMTRHTATVFGPQGIRCNAIAPGLIGNPDGVHRMPSVISDIFCAASPIPRLGVPRDIANMVVFLASDLSSFITGQVISVDGGILVPLSTVAPMRALTGQSSPFGDG
jgi:NAD(P)-dependent dehydrogenase (short-subunit alcohol dehydrogenase family)